MCVVSRAGRGGAGTEYLMLRRAEDGLLGGMWEFPSVVCSSTASSSAPPLQRRQQLLDALLASHLPAASLSSCTARRSIGSLVHVFSHRRHLMQVEAMTVMAAPAAAEERMGEKEEQQRREREHGWMTEEGMLRVGLTTGQRKVLQLLRTAEQPDAAAVRGRRSIVAVGDEKEEEAEEEYEEGKQEETEQMGDQEEQEEWEVWPTAVAAPLPAGPLVGDSEVIVID